MGMLLRQTSKYAGIVVHDKNIIATFTEIRGLTDIPYHDSNVTLYTVGLDIEQCYQYATKLGISRLVTYYLKGKTHIIAEETAFNCHLKQNEELKWREIAEWMNSYPTILYQKKWLFLALAFITSCRSSCLRRKVGAVIIQDTPTINYNIVSTGYNGSPAMRQPCIELGYCYRDQHQIPSGTQLERCRASGSHGESNAIALASKHGQKVYQSDMYIYGHYACCDMCKGLIANAGISRVIHLRDDFQLQEIQITPEWLMFGYND